MVLRRASRKQPKNLSLPKNLTRKRSGFRPRLSWPDPSYAPGSDFYSYVNAKWLNSTHIPSTRASYGVSEEIEEMWDKEGLKLLSCLGKTKDKLKRTLGLVSASVLDSKGPERNLELVKTLVASIQSAISKEEIAVLQGEFARFGIDGLLYLHGQYETRTTKVYTLTLGVGSLGLPDSSFYFEGSLGRAHIRAQYKRFLQKVGERFGIPLLECLVPLERILAGVLSMTGNDTVEIELTGAEVETKFRHVPWEHLFSAYGVDRWRQRVFCIESNRWIHTLNKLYKHLEVDHWKLLLCQQVLLYSLPWLPPPFPQWSFQMYRKELRGQPNPLSLPRKALAVVQAHATPLYSRLFVKELTNPSLKRQVTEMVEELKEAAKDHIDSLQWMEKATKEKAKAKIQAMGTNIGYPDSFEPLSLPSLSADCLLANLLHLGDWSTKRDIGKLGQPLSKRKEWDDAVFAVNAYYYEEANEIVIPYGIFHFPFFDPSASAAWNYGGLGCVLGHEITHAFDKEGKEFDPKGYQHPWWTVKDNRAYNKHAQGIVALYNTQKVNGIPVNGRKTLSENIADIGGMAIALQAFRTKLDATPLTEQERHQAYREFFVSYATTWRTLERSKSRIQSSLLSRHAPAPVRVNLVVCQFQEWYDAFGIEPTDPLYLPPEKRLHGL